MSEQPPERIWAYDDRGDPNERSWPLHWYSSDNGDDAEFVGEYLRADTAIPRTEADAMVAAAYLDAASICAVFRDTWGSDGRKDFADAAHRLEGHIQHRAEVVSSRAALDAIVREAVEAERERLVPTLAALLKLYVDLAASGDCGNWDPEGDDEVIAARAALATIREEPTS